MKLTLNMEKYESDFMNMYDTPECEDQFLALLLFCSGSV